MTQLTAMIDGNHRGAMAAQDDEEAPLQKRFGDFSFDLYKTAAIALIATCLRVWVGIEVLQKEVTSLTQSDAQQNLVDRTHTNDINNLRVQVGVLRETVRLVSGGKP